MQPDPVTSWNVVLTLGVLINLAVGIVGLRRSGQTQKREITFGDQVVTKDACALVHRTVDARLQAVEQKMEASRAESSESRARLYSHIDKVRVELKADVEANRRELSEKIDQIPAQVIVTLTNTGAIRR